MLGLRARLAGAGLQMCNVPGILLICHFRSTSWLDPLGVTTPRARPTLQGAKSSLRV